MASWKQGKIKFGFLETATSGGTLTLTSSSLQYQILTGSLSHTVQLPNATTLAQGTGIAFCVVNVSTGTVTVKLNDTTTTLVTLVAGQGASIYLTDNSTSNGVWVPKTGGAGASSGIVAYAPGAVKTSAYQVLSSDNSDIILCDTTAGSINVTLPTPVAGFKVTIKDIGGLAGTNIISILRFLGTELIDNVLTDTQIDENGMAISFETDGTNWTRMDSLHRSSITTTGRGVFGGGSTGSDSAVIDYIQISTTGNATSFGNLSAARKYIASASSTTRGLWAGGSPGTTIDYVTIATTGNALSFGTLTTSRQGTAGCGSSTRGVFGGDVISPSAVIDYVTFATLGNATSFGSLTVARGILGACSSPTRGVWGGGTPDGGTTFSAVMDYVTIATTGNATSFGSLSQGREWVSACANSTRGLWAGGNQASGTWSAVIDYITIATTGNATSFGSLTTARDEGGACSSAIRAVFGGGATISNIVSTIDYVFIATAANAASFGSLTLARQGLAACSSSHGGLSG